MSKLGSTFRRRRLIAMVAVCGCTHRPARESPTDPPTDTAPQPVVAVAWGAPSPVAKTARFTWWEAEGFSSSNFPAANPFAPASADEAAVLSGGAWIGSANTSVALFAEYEVSVLQAGEFGFHARKFWRHGPFRWRFDDGPWQRCGADVALLDDVSMRQHVGANWVNLGVVSLDVGLHRFRLEVDPGTPAVAFDAFVLSDAPFAARGKLKPDETYTRKLEGWEVFDPAADDFEPSPIDLRFMNQASAGDEGFVRRAGDHFEFEQSGELVRFWGVNATPNVLDMTGIDQRRYAKRLAKLGVNLVRVCAPFWREGSFREVDSSKVDRLQRLAAMLSEQGIYLSLSIYFPVWLRLAHDAEFPGYEGKQPFALSYFSEAFRDVMKEWWRAVLLTPSPYTGLPLARDPTLALLELVNEDSTFFGTFKPYRVIPETTTHEVEAQFGAWLSVRYGSVSKALEVWSSPRIKGDEPEVGRVGLLPLWNVAHDGSTRARDTAEFLARSMRDAYADMHDFLRRALGAHALTICSNWTTVDELVLGPLDNWANSVCDVMDRHGYFAGPHLGDSAAHTVRAGQQYDDSSMLQWAGRNNGAAPPTSVLPFIEPRVNGRPHVVSELGWSWPNRFRAEGPLLVAAYGSLHDVDGLMWFASGAVGWAQSLGKFEVSDLAIMGQFPAAAAIYRQGLVRGAEPVVDVTLSEGSLFALRGVPLAAQTGLDALRAPGAQERRGNSRDAIATLLRGPVNERLGEGADALEDEARQSGVGAAVVGSHTGELTWDADKGLVTLVAPRANAAVGFVGSASGMTLPAIDVTLENDYASVALVSLDGEPLSRSKSMLLQVVTEVSNAGFEAAGHGVRRIAAAGGPPVLLRSIRGHVRLHGHEGQELTVTALDGNGQATRSLHSPRPGAGLPLLPDVTHYVLTLR